MCLTMILHIVDAVVAHNACWKINDRGTMYGHCGKLDEEMDPYKAKFKKCKKKYVNMFPIINTMYCMCCSLVLLYPVYADRVHSNGSF